MSSTPKYWRSLAQADQTKEYLASLKTEFAPYKPLADEPLSRRSFLKFLGASAALSGLGACTREPIHKIVPYVKRPEESVPGQPLHYATAMPFNGFGVGLLVESHEGHPTKIEGNPSHPASLGATNIFQQAALLDLYDPDRSTSITNAQQASNYALFLSALDDELRRAREQHGDGLRILSQTITSPTLTAQLEEFLRTYPKARWHQYQPINRDNTLEAAQQLFGRAVETRCHFDRARVIVSLDADFLFAHPNNINCIEEFASGRDPGRPMNRLYVAEPTPSITGSMADHRLRAASSEVEQIALGLAAALGVPTQGAAPRLPEEHQQWMQAAAKDLQQNRGACVVIAGEWQPPSTHVTVHLLNQRLGNVGHTMDYADSAEKYWINQHDSLAGLVNDMEAGSVECLVVLGGNPAFDAPVEMKFQDHLSKVKLRLHLSLEQNETSVHCHWHIPESHFLESWSDARSFDGTVSLIQPLIHPLYASKTAHELLHYIVHQEERDDYAIVRDHWHSQKLSDDFEKSWREILHAGWIADSQLPPISIQPRADLLPVAAAAPPKSAGSSLEICFRPDPCIWDGRFANNGWLQELPKPFSKLTWDNAALISPALAQRLGTASGDVAVFRFHGRVLASPVWIMPGQADDTVTMHLGYGRLHSGRYGSGTGVNTYALRDSQGFWGGGNLELQKTDKRTLLATTQETQNMHGRDIIRTSTLAQYLADSAATSKNYEPAPSKNDSLYNPGQFANLGYAWGMSIDLNRCVGCNACAVACQAENNIPVVGKPQVNAGRYMHWIRIDNYFSGARENPGFHHQPVPCMHCETAPCELVCPVGATLHDHEGLNLQIYNRCVGTRYCSNNCPYKVRRFNFYRFADYETPSLKPMRNPNVTVRWRGVMEKCTYCIQRIEAAKIAAELQNRSVRDGEIQTACQQVCPARAIIFGNINDPVSAVSKLKALPLNYSLLGELNTQPRTTYLARLRNPNPDLAEKS